MHVLLASVTHALVHALEQHVESAEHTSIVHWLSSLSSASPAAHSECFAIVALPQLVAAAATQPASQPRASLASVQ